MNTNIPKKCVKAAQLLVDYLNDNNIGNTEILKDELIKFLQIKSIYTTCNPSVYCQYSQDNRSGYFSADAVVSLSLYITNLICDASYHYSDVLGKHSELTVNITDVDWDYCDEDSEEEEEHYRLNMDEPCIKYDESIFESINEELEDYMNTLEPITIEKFKTERYDMLVKYASDLLDEKLKTNNPTILLTKIVPTYTRNFWNRTEEIQFKIPLSKVLTFIVVDSDINVNDKWDKTNRWEYSTYEQRIFKINTMTMTPIKQVACYNRVITSYWDQNKDQLDKVNQKIKDILNEYPKEDAVEFFTSYYQEILDKCYQLNLTN